MFIQAFAPLQIYLQKACQKDKTLTNKHLQELEIVKMSAIAHKRCAFSHTRTRVHKKNPIYLLKYFIIEFAHSVISYNFIHYLRSSLNF